MQKLGQWEEGKRQNWIENEDIDQNLKPENWDEYDVYFKQKMKELVDFNT